MPNIPIIGLAGPARSGKDTVASFIIAAVGGYRYAFADPIRQMLVPLGIDMNDPYWQERKEKIIPALNASPRKLMQTLGTEWGRQLIDPNIWLTLASQRLLTRGAGMVIPDVRFENEAEWVRNKGGRIIHVVRANPAQVETHVSENGVAKDPLDAILFNSGTLEELQIATRELLHVYQT